MKKLTYKLFIISTFALLSCSSSNQTTQADTYVDPHKEMHENYSNEEKQKMMIENYAKEISGTYLGMIPCADCEKISYKIQLKPDMTYHLKYTYIGKTDAPIEKSGNYHVIINRLIIQLDNIANGMNFIKKQPYGLLLLDKNGKEITGDLADKYKLLPITKDTETSSENRLQQILIKKQEQGIDFYAFGNEPSWSLDMDFEKEIHFKNMNGIDFYAPAATPEKAMDANITRVRSVTDFGEIIVQIKHSSCTDNMSGKNFDYSVSIDFKQTNNQNYESFNGCGNYIPDYRLHDLWAITEVDGMAIDPSDYKKDSPRIEFNLTENTVFGTDGCNTFRGSLTVKKDQIQMDNLASTMMACIDNMEISTQIGQILSGKNLRYTIENNLILYDGTKKVMELKHID